MKINKYVLGLLSLLILTIGIGVGILLVGQNQDIREKAAPATATYISPTTQDAQIGSDFSFYVKMDSASNQISGVDIRLSFDKNNIQIVSLEKGSGASNLETPIASTFDNSTGKIKYIIYTGDKTKAISGSGVEILKINAKSKSNATIGEYSFTFDSETAASGISETQNILTSLTLGKVKLVEASTGSNNNNTTEGEPNSCGGTCGSNFNCKANLYCYKGYCRNPLCSDKTDCNCSTVAATTKATTKAQATNKSQTKGEGGVIAKGSPKPTPSYISGITRLTDEQANLEREKDEDTAPENMFFSKYAIYIFGLFLVIVIVSIVAAVKKNRNNNIPHILPPTNI